MSDYVSQFSNFSEFNTSESWVVLSSIEKQIKIKIERIGTPLKNWNIRINYGIKTGYNEAFIIDGKKKDQLIAEDPKSADIIRPLLRGRDIKRYSHEYADLYLITTFPSLKIDIDSYPSVKQHLIGFGFDRLKQTGDKGARKKTNNQWFETQDSISYWEDFFRPKIIYPNMTKFLPFMYDDKEYLTNQKCFIITGEKIEFLVAFLNSSLFKYCFKENFPELQGGTRELSKIFFDKISILHISEEMNLHFKSLIDKVHYLKYNNEASKEIELQIDNKIFELYNLTDEEKNEVGFIEIQ
ncbi:TaqI-like C-terminal specificity domain-containing protein [Flavobacterium eburneipallidum]|uniref:TaqI-like C-terminal specificity domain-containing protein n=1 Tax=Flavobacterium eburneipallidum TaxID=3003263 RepID=UPI002482B682|nr:TaqI-like C-terminal specificity domain-containing protein [Flavobacterium eburneipallidum]